MPDYRGKFEGIAPKLPSIASQTVTYQALCAVKESNGYAVVVNDGEAEAAKTDLAIRCGVYAERSSAIAWKAIETLKSNSLISSDDRVLAVITAHGYKDAV